MTLSFNETNALSTLQTIVTAIQEVDELRSTNANLSAQYAEDQTTIATLLDTRHNLESTLAEVRQALTEALNREAQLRIDLAETQSRLVDEQRLAGQHWDNLRATSTTLAEVESNLHATIFDRNRTAAKLTEAEDKLTRFRDILGIPHPVEPAAEPLSLPAPSPEPVVEVVSAPDSEAVTSDDDDVVIHWDSLKAQPEEAETTVNPTSPPQSGLYRYL